MVKRVTCTNTLNVIKNIVMVLCETNPKGRVKDSQNTDLIIDNSQLVATRDNQAVPTKSVQDCKKKISLISE